MTRCVNAARTRVIAIFCVVVAILLPTPALAHVKWFVDASAYPLRADLIWSDRTLIWLASSASALTLLFLLDRTVARRSWPWTGWLRHLASGAPTVLSIQVAISLIATAIHPALLAPNLDLPMTPVGMALCALEVMIAFSFITGFGDWLGGISLIALVALVAVMFSPLDALEQIFWAGIGVTMVVIGRDGRTNRMHRLFHMRPDPVWRRRALIALRILTGTSLIVVALTEKLWNPDLGRAFLLERPELNIFQTLPGMSWFTNDVFVLAAGLTEAAIGIMLMSGLVPRLVILAMWVPFNLGIPVLPSQELLGHLPILGIIYFLLVDGAAIPNAVARTRRVRTARASVQVAPVAALPATLHSHRGARREQVELVGGGAHH